MTADLLVIMARYPTPGKVKTRLAMEIGARAAADFYRQLIEYHVVEFFDPPFDLEWRYTPAHAPFQRVVGAAARLVPQPPGDLGRRLRLIFADSFAQGYERVVVIGTDCPAMTQRTARRALRLLRAHDAVVQPTVDGGYALVGLRRLLPIFAGILWGTDRVMTQTRQRLQTSGASYKELPVTFDVDTVADLRRLRKGFQ